MRTTEQIVQFIRSKQNEILSFAPGAVLDYLPFDQAKEFLKPEAKPEDWAEVIRPLTTEVVVETMRSYMSFAWVKVEDHRGISASRSVEKMEAWLWLLEDEQCLSDVEQAPYENYGAPKLAVICNKYGFPIPVSARIQNMIAGQRCTSDCKYGCSR